jgi:hypothetical protein
MTSNLRLRLVAALAVCTIAPVLAHCATTSSSPGDSGFAGSSSSSGGLTGSSGSGTSSSSSSAGSSNGSGTSSGSSGDDQTGDATTGDDGGLITVNSPDADPSCAPNVKYPQTTFVNLAVPMGSPVTKGQSDAIPADAGAIPAVPGWDFHQGGLCRDGSPAGFYVHFSASSSDKLYIYLEGGGACDSATFCSHNPANIQQVFSGGPQTEGQTIAGSTLAFATTGQVPYTPIAASGATAAYSPGIFDFTNTANPFKDWNAVYVPYCTGDVHFGTNNDVDIPGDGVLPDEPHQHFVGHTNLAGYIGRIVPTFPKMSQVLLTGASAGGFAAGLNYGMVQDSFGKTPVVVIDDSGPPFSAMYLPACLQKEWRNLWGFDAALPSDCTECKNADGSGLTDVVYYWLHKYPNAKVGFVSTMQDEVIRLFFSQELNSCGSNNATALTLGQALCGGYTCDMYTAGLNDLLTTFKCTGRLASYYVGGTNTNYMNPSFHQHIFRNEFYQAITNDGSITMAQWASDFISGKLENVGP